MSNSNLYKRTILKKSLPSNHLAESRQLRIFLPPGYDERIAYPVVYCQDGEQFFNFGRIATVATELILEQNIQPMIIVGVDVDVQKRTSEYSPEGQRFSAYCSFFIEELLPYIEGILPVRDTAEGRVIAGDSLGATVSLHLALDHPSKLRNVLSLSGAYLASSQSRVTHETNLSDLDIYMLIGEQEQEVVTANGTFDFLQLNRTMQGMLLERKAQLVYREADGKHIWGFWQKYMAEALLHFFK